MGIVGRQLPNNGLLITLVQELPKTHQYSSITLVHE
jgi:hypothetical protein